MRLLGSLTTAACAIACLGTAPEENPPLHVNQLTTAVFVEHSCQVPGSPSGPFGLQAIDLSLTSEVWGSCFAYQPSGRVANDKCLVVTAKHVLAMSPLVRQIVTLPKDDSKTEAFDPKQGGDAKPVMAGKSKAISHSTRIRIGGLSIKPSRILLSSDPHEDLALMEITRDEAAKLTLKILSKAPLEAVKRGTEVTAYGHPALEPTAQDRVKDNGDRKPRPSAESIPQIFIVGNRTESKISCTPQNARETRGGFSGGPIVSGASEGALAVITLANSEATIALPMESVDRLAEKFDREAVVYVEQ